MNPVTDILARAVVPEHSAPFMQAVSGGRVLTVRVTRERVEVENEGPGMELRLCGALRRLETDGRLIVEL